MNPPTAPPVDAAKSGPLGRIALGAVACLGFAAHALWHVANETPWDALWICHLAALMIGVGTIFGFARLNGAGFLCAALGLPSWMFYLLSGEPLIPTSLLTHVAAPLVGLLGVRAMGLPRGTAPEALGIVAGLTVVSAWITPPAANVNLAHGPIEGLSLWKTGGALHYLLLLLQWAVGLFVAQALGRWIFGRAGWIRDPQAAGPADADRLMK